MNSLYTMLRVLMNFTLLCERPCIQFVCIQQDNKFTALFDSLSQVQSVPETFLAVTSALIDGTMTYSFQSTLEVLSVAQIIISQTSKPSKRRAKLKKPTR